ncbi:rRNA maturation RNase YbeY [Undibacter mobilis]|uniref:Endoribonuclease YbeY n=1 Tax=Undibacter mobilis TaxID=2292256 RepID=A0A371B8R2_9BRAD|nr:rRNA maturation RNase YbeY [Undibacter mobilis]RDV03944.1 rRNA maturation RNase YbeY [Undibacter mobilis]
MTAVTADIVIESDLWAAEPRAEATVGAAISAAAAHSTRGGEVSILLSDDSAVRDLNRQFRGLDKPTNVLSFPAADTPATQGHLGDIVIAYETLRRECEAEDRLFIHHLAHLTAHGFLHLIGYDHQTDAQADEMEALESRIMTAMNMPDPWQDARSARDLEHGDA